MTNEKPTAGEKKWIENDDTSNCGDGYHISGCAHSKTPSQEKLVVVPSPRIDYCGDCKKDHGYNCPQEKPERFKGSKDSVCNDCFDDGFKGAPCPHIDVQEKPEWHRDFDTLLGEYTSGNIGVASLIAFISTVEASAYERGKAEPHNTADGYCCACDYDIARFEGKLAAASEQGELEGSWEGYDVGHTRALKETMMLVESMKEWPEPVEGAGEELGALAGMGMYMQYDADRKKHREQISEIIGQLTALIGKTKDHD